MRLAAHVVVVGLEVLVFVLLGIALWFACGPAYLERVLNRKKER